MTEKSISKKAEHVIQARKLARSMHSGVLSTVSLSVNGFPFGSVTPYLMTEAGDLVVYASDIAQHSRNMKADSRVSLCIHDASQSDSQASARLTFLANAQADAVDEATQHKYMSLFPQAKKYVQAHDFRFYLLKLERLRYIGGFGEIYWFSEHDWNVNLHSIAEQEAAIVNHMNLDHKDAMLDMVHSFTEHKSEEEKVNMLSCYAEGFHVMVNQKVIFIPFMQPLSEAYDARRAMVDLTHSARRNNLELAAG
jgi:putative heme iron utilization protein